MTSMTRHGIRLPARQDLGRLSPCVCNTLRMVTRAVTQLYDEMLRPSGLRVTQFSVLAALARMGEANLRQLDRKSTRLNSSHLGISYAVFCLKKKTKDHTFLRTH